MDQARTSPDRTRGARIAINGIPFEPRVKAGRTFEGTVDVTDRENDKLTYVWEVLKEATITATGGAYEPRPDRVGEVQTTDANKVSIAIAEPGYYRLYAYILDGTGFVSTGQYSFCSGMIGCLWYVE